MREEVRYDEGNRLAALLRLTYPTNQTAPRLPDTERRGPVRLTPRRPRPQCHQPAGCQGDRRVGGRSAPRPPCRTRCVDALGRPVYGTSTCRAP
ncbi:hypothetical protein HBB16_09770 [Pseudonocardia sp. MCCB 268]|nr:hypothetical protein [Pseudonocardia cytotoxica]